MVINLDPQEASYTLSASGLKELAYFANLLFNYLESYWIVFRSIKYLQKKRRSEKEFLKRIQSIGAKLHKLGEVERTEALSEATFRNAIKIFGEKGIVLKKAPEGQGRHHLQPACRRRRQRILRPPTGQVSQKIELRGRVVGWTPILNNHLLLCNPSQAKATASPALPARCSPGKSQVTCKAITGLPSFRAMAASDTVP